MKTDLEIGEAVQTSLELGLCVHDHCNGGALLRSKHKAGMTGVYAADGAFRLLAVMVTGIVGAAIAARRGARKMPVRDERHLRAVGRQRRAGSCANDQNRPQYGDRELTLEQESQAVYHGTSIPPRSHRTSDERCIGASFAGAPANVCK